MSHAAVRLVAFVCLLLLPQAVGATVTPSQGSERLLAWMYAYREKPRPSQVPALVHQMRKMNLLREQKAEGTGFITGFLAGVLGKNPRSAPSLVARMFPMPPKEQAVIVRAIAYSGLRNWKQLLRKSAKRMPERRDLIEAFLSGKEKPLLEAPLADGTHVVYTLWGYYVATGSQEPIVRLMAALRWTRTKEDEDFSLDKLASALGFGDENATLKKMTIGGTAKWTLAIQSETDRELLKLYKAQLGRQPENVAGPLKEVIEAGEQFKAEDLRKRELAVIKTEEHRLMRNGNGMSRVSYAGSILLSGACVIAGATGHMEIAVPCVITGVVYTGVNKLLQNAP